MTDAVISYTIRFVCKADSQMFFSKETDVMPIVLYLKVNWSYQVTLDFGLIA